MRYLSTFSGIGGFELGIQRAIPNAECIGFSEIDKYATKVYKHHFPNHKEYGDITKIDTATLPDFDCLVGGFPCQAFSIAGKRGGFEDTRGTLFFELARILRDKRPRHFVFENVKGLLSHDSGNTFKTIITTLDELGYFVEWQVLNSKNFGVPQNRERVFIIGHLGGIPTRKVFPIRTGSELPIAGGREGGAKGEISSTITKNYHKGVYSGGETYAIQQLNKPKHSNDRVCGEEGISPTLNTMHGGNRQPKILAHYGHKNKAPVKMDISPTLKAQSHGHEPMILRDGRDNRSCLRAGSLELGVEGKSIRRLTPLECERLQAFPDNWTDCVSDTQRYKTLGNAVTVNVISAIFSKLGTPPFGEINVD